jgi:hypothetical protein
MAATGTKCIAVLPARCFFPRQLVLIGIRTVCSSARTLSQGRASHSGSAAFPSRPSRASAEVPLSCATRSCPANTETSTFQACAVGLGAASYSTDDLALAVLAEWNARCRPPREEHEFRGKRQRARRMVVRSCRRTVSGEVNAVCDAHDLRHASRLRRHSLSNHGPHSLGG